VFVKQLYKRRKLVFFLFAGACLVQAIIFWKQGAVFSPFYNYGMYSERIMPKQNYTIYKVYADDVLLRGQDFTTQQWDKIYLPVFMYLPSDSINNEMIEIRNRLLQKTHLTAGMRNEFFTNEHLTEEMFMNWYRQQLRDITGKPINKVSVIKYNYSWNKSTLQVADSVMVMKTEL